ncbi:hypothetical protein ACL6C3_13135 [Capilliphycus salinus ALCB114379]
MSGPGSMWLYGYSIQELHLYYPNIPTFICNGLIGIEKEIMC